MAAEIDSLVEREERGAVTADATWEADRATGPRNQPDADLWERDRRVLVGDDRSGEGSHFDARAHARSVEVDGDAIACRLDQPYPGCA